MGLLKGGRIINWKLVGGISSGWVITPIIAALMSFISLFFMQNVFMQETFKPVQYQITKEAALRIKEAGVSTSDLETLVDKKFQSAVKMKKALSNQVFLTPKILEIVLSSSKIYQMEITKDKIDLIGPDWVSNEQKIVIEKLEGKKYMHKWQLTDALEISSPLWKFHDGDKEFNEDLNSKFLYVCELFGN